MTNKKWLRQLRISNIMADIVGVTMILALGLIAWFI
jgi:hypothetical protein